MGFLKKLTRPISRVLDKIVPNEIKPALPFLAAALPFIGPAQGIMGQSMLRRALMSGGANILGQLAQEGSEGDFSVASAALASGIGALSAPNAASTLRGVGKTPGVTGADAGFFVGEGMKVPQGSTSFLGKAADFAATGADKLEGIIAAGRAEPFSMAGLKAASIPITQGTMDLAVAETNRLNKQQIIDDALGGLGEGASDADRALAIRLAMQQYGFDEDEISETIESAGYKDGGIIGLQVEMIEGKKDGGLMDLGGKEMDLRGGGFVPIGKKEKADDVPARLSKNEFVMTADAVRAAGGGSVNKGAKRMYDLMDRLEARA